MAGGRAHRVGSSCKLVGWGVAILIVRQDLEVRLAFEIVVGFVADAVVVEGEELQHFREYSMTMRCIRCPRAVHSALFVVFAMKVAVAAVAEL
jgi:hypothetical protein